MAIETRRGCGYRKVGGLYLVSGEVGRPCGMLPLPLDVCPCCGGGIKQTRGFTWIDPSKLFEARRCNNQPVGCSTCTTRAATGQERAGLVWIGKQHYPTVSHFLEEARVQGVSRRIPAVPRNFVVGETFVFLAFPEVVPVFDPEKKVDVLGPGICAVFLPKRIEKILNESDRENEVELKRLERQGVTPIFVPDDDPDHH